MRKMAKLTIYNFFDKITHRYSHVVYKMLKHCARMPVLQSCLSLDKKNAHFMNLCQSVYRLSFQFVPVGGDFLG